MTSLFSRINTSWIILTAGAIGLTIVAFGWMNPLRPSYQSIVVKPAGFELQFSRQHETSLQGQAFVRPGNDTFSVRVRLENIRKGATYNIHLHEGTCSRGGGGGLPLNSLRNEQSSAGVTSTVVKFDRLNPTLDHLLMVHRADGHHVLCADFPSMKRLKSFQPEPEGS